MFVLAANSKLKIGHGCPILSTSPSKCVNLRQTSQPKANIVVAVAGVAVDPRTDDAELRVIVPATAASDAANASRATLRVNYKSAGCISSIICSRIIIPIKTPFPYIPAHIV